MEIKKVLVTPEDALNWITNCNHSNRHLDSKRVKSYANDIKKGNWQQDTGEFIKFSKTGRLIDGQHRLSAVIESKMSVFFDICYGLSDDVFMVIDTGKSRSASDVLNVKGVKNSNLIASIIQKNNAIIQNTITCSKDKSLSNSSVLEIYNENPNYWDEITHTSTSLYRKFNRILPVSMIGGYISVFDKKNAEKSRLFFEQLCTGKNIENSSIDVLRNKLIQNKVKKSIHFQIK